MGMTIESRSHLDPDTLGGYGIYMNGYTNDKADVQKRLHRIEGQVRGLQKMVDEDRYCIDVLAQVSSVTKALEGVAVLLFDDHLRHCVADAVAAGGPDAQKKLTEATAAVARLLKS